ncbi:MAG: alpha/beta fold hydrolase, partial [Candidatus Aminicenantales bacterium]
MSTKITLGMILMGAAMAMVLAAGAAGKNARELQVIRKTCRSADGVEIVYSVAGTGEPALVFVHGGLANRGFWDGQLKA